MGGGEKEKGEESNRLTHSPQVEKERAHSLLLFILLLR